MQGLSDEERRRHGGVTNGGMMCVFAVGGERRWSGRSPPAGRSWENSAGLYGAVTGEDGLTVRCCQSGGWSWWRGSKWWLHLTISTKCYPSEEGNFHELIMSKPAWCVLSHVHGQMHVLSNALPVVPLSYFGVRCSLCDRCQCLEPLI